MSQRIALFVVCALMLSLSAGAAPAKKPAQPLSPVAKLLLDSYYNETDYSALTQYLQTQQETPAPLANHATPIGEVSEKPASAGEAALP